MSEQASIVNFWNHVMFKCGHGCEHGNISLTQRTVMKSTFLVGVCSECGEEFSYAQIEKAMTRLQQEIVNSNENGEEANLTNFRWRTYDAGSQLYYHFRVVRHRNENLTVSIRKDASPN